MKLSKYVRVIRDGHKTILFNTINSCIVTFDAHLNSRDEDMLDNIVWLESVLKNI